MVLWVSMANDTRYFRPENKNKVFVQCFSNIADRTRQMMKKKNSELSSFYWILAMSYLSGPSPAKYFRRKEA